MSLSRVWFPFPMASLPSWSAVFWKTPISSRCGVLIGRKGFPCHVSAPISIPRYQQYTGSSPASRCPLTRARYRETLSGLFRSWTRYPRACLFAVQHAVATPRALHQHMTRPCCEVPRPAVPFLDYNAVIPPLRWILLARLSPLAARVRRREILRPVDDIPA